MYRNKRGSKKGYVMLYSIILGLICMCLVIYSFTLSLKVRKNYLEQIKYSKNKLAIENDRDYLITKAKEKIYDNVKINNLEDVRKYLVNERHNYKITANVGVVEYDNVGDMIIIETYFDEGLHISDYYSYLLENEKIIFKLRKSELENGMLGVKRRVL